MDQVAHKPPKFVGWADKLKSLFERTTRLAPQGGVDARSHFRGAELELAKAIDRNNPRLLVAALERGAAVNAVGAEGMTPVMYALVRRSKDALRDLLEHGADPNRLADNGQNAVTLAARLAPQDLDFLRIVLEHSGDPDAREPNGDPILVRMIAESALDGIRLLKEKGADVNILDRNETPAVLLAATIQNWHAAYTLLMLGADWTRSQGGRTLAWAAHSAQKEGSSADVWLQKTREFLKAQGVQFPPPSPKQVQQQIAASPVR